MTKTPSKRASSFSMTTIVAIILLLATLLAILFFFTGGFDELATAIAGIGSQAATDAGTVDSSPSDWDITSSSLISLAGGMK